MVCAARFPSVYWRPPLPMLLPIFGNDFCSGQAGPLKTVHATSAVDVVLT